eukprot:s365_g2.t1
MPGSLPLAASVNCSEQSCGHDQNLCGEYRQACKAIGPESFGLQLWHRDGVPSGKNIGMFCTPAEDGT